MAVEPKRGCGFRKMGGLYLVAEPGGWKCDRLPIEMVVCPCCGEGVRQTRGWKWIDPIKMFGDHNHFDPAYCDCPPECPACHPGAHFNTDPEVKAGLLWVGTAFYPTPQDFLSEGAQLGFSRRISTLPLEFRAGKTWVFMGHPKAIVKDLDGAPIEEPRPGVFMAIRPKKVERIVKQSELDMFKRVVRIELRCFNQFDYDSENIRKVQIDEVGEDGMEIYRRLQNDVNRGIVLVPVPDDDPDHQGRVK